jgi:hypothetical protein
MLKGAIDTLDFGNIFEREIKEGSILQGEIDTAWSLEG